MKILFTYFFSFLIMMAAAQAPYLYFNRITTSNGLSHNKVNCILQDKRGFIWLGTEDGLNRYDGQYFTVFRNKPNDSTSISGNIINDLLEDENGVLWIATADGGLTKYDYRQPAANQFKQFKHIAGDTSTIAINIINKIVEDNKGFLWLATSGFYVLRFDKKAEQFYSPINSGTRTASALLIDNNNTLWVGRTGGSFLKLNLQTLQYNTGYNNLYNTKLPHATITSLFKDDEQNIWFGSWDNVLYRYNYRTKNEDVFKQDASAYSFPNDEATAFVQDKQKRIWIAGKYAGLTLYDKTAKRFYNYRYDASQEGSIADNRINCAYIDKNDVVWLGTNNGVSIHNPSQQPFVQTFLSKEKKDVTVYDFYQQPDNSLWIGTNDGIYIQQTGKPLVVKKVLYKNQPLSITKFFKDVDGSMYIGTQYSLFKYDADKNIATLLPNTDKDSVMNRIISSRVVSIIRDTIENHPVFLVSPYGHYITYYDLAENKWVSRTDSIKKIVTRFNLKDNLIRKFYKDSKSNIWLATAKYGLGKWQKKSLPLIDHLCNNPKSGLSITNDNVYDIIEDSKNNLWVSTYGGGLNYYDTKTQSFSHVEASNNLLEGAQTDMLGNVWLISNGNLNKYNIITKIYTTFALPDLEKSGGVKGYLFKDNDGKLYAAGNNYFISFNPLDVKENDHSPEVYFTDFKIFNTSYPHLLQQKNIELRYYQNYFSFEFSAPEFTGEPVEYSYMLQGVDKDWIDAGSHNFANYSNLPGGNYIFKVKAGNKKSNQANNIATLNINIIPPFWKRWWFFAICFIVVGSAIYMFYRYRINELLKRQAIRNKIAQDLHDSMGSTLSSISVYSQVAKIYHTQDKQQQLQETLEKIGETSGDMINEMSDIVWAINPKNDNMQTIIQRMESFARPLLQAKNIQFVFNYNEDILSMQLNMEKRKNFYLIFKEAVNNALKYSECKMLAVEIRKDQSVIALKVKDDGKGFSIKEVQAGASKSLSGNGLKNMQMRADEMKAIIKIDSKTKEGTAILLEFNIP